MSTRNGYVILSGMYQKRAAVWEGVEPPRGRGRLSGVRETQLLLHSNQSNRVEYTKTPVGGPHDPLMKSGLLSLNQDTTRLCSCVAVMLMFSRIFY